jgi:macrolide transport system ATP-binding/permease protein
MFHAEGVSKSYGGLDVLEDVSFVVGAVSAWLVGPNARATTLLRLLAGEDEPDAGTAGHRESLGYLRQEAGLDPRRALVEELWTAFRRRARRRRV